MSDRFRHPEGLAPTSFRLTLADLANGIDCVSGGRFPAEVVLTMAGHIIQIHASDTSWESILTAVEVVEPDPDEVSEVEVEAPHGPWLN